MSVYIFHSGTTHCRHSCINHLLGVRSRTLLGIRLAFSSDHYIEASSFLGHVLGIAKHVFGRRCSPGLGLFKIPPPPPTSPEHQSPGRFKRGIPSNRAFPRDLSSTLALRLRACLAGLPGGLGWPIKAEGQSISGQWPPGLSPCPCLFLGRYTTSRDLEDKGDDEMLIMLLHRSQKTCQKMASQVT